MKIKRLLSYVLLLTAFTGFAGAACADMNPGNDSASMELTIMPNFERGILIDTDTANMLDMGGVEMGVATQTVHPATVTVIGTISNTELEMSANITGGWRFDDDVTTMEQDNLAVWSVFKSTTDAAVPSKSGSDFDDANDALSPASPAAYFGLVRVGLAGGDTGNGDRFEDGDVNMDSMMPDTKRHWWFYFRTPNTTSTVNEQKVTFVLTVTPGN